MTNALFDAGWARMVPETCKHEWYYSVELTPEGRAALDSHP